MTAPLSPEPLDLIERLRAFRGPWLGDGVHPSINRDEIVATIERQQAEIAALRDDARRYRWLRECRGIKLPTDKRPESNQLDANWQWLFLDDADAAIDAEIARTKGEPS